MHVSVSTSRTVVWSGAVLLVVGVLTVAHVRTGGPDVSSPSPAHVPTRLTGEARSRALEHIAAVPLHFERNRGQARPGLDFVATGAGYRVGLAPTGATLLLADHGTPRELKLVLEGAHRDATGAPLDTLPGVASYYRGNNPADWQVGVSTHGRVRYAGVLDGIDVVYYGNQRRLQYDFVIAPGADPRQIAIRVDGVDELSVGTDGRLRMVADDRVIEQERPFTYQLIDGRRVEVPSRFLVEGRVVRFEVDAYDTCRELVIDPVIAYSTFFGGSGEEGVLDLAIAPDGGLVAYGWSEDLEGILKFPTTVGANKVTRGADSDAFVAKFNAAGNALVFSTLLGGSGFENSQQAYNFVGGMAVDGSGNVHVTGTTRSVDFPMLNASDADYNDDDPGAIGPDDGFYARLSPTGALQVGTYYGGRYSDIPFGLDVDAAGNAYIVGRTSSSASTVSPGTGFFPIVGAANDNSLSGSTDFFVARFNTAGALDYSTYVGGTGYEVAGAADIRASRTTANVVYVGGDAGDSSFPTIGTVQAFNVGPDAVVFRMNLALAAGNQITWSTFLGGNGVDYVNAIAVDGTDRIYVAGATSSTEATFPAMVTWSGSSAPSSTDVFVGKFDASLGASARVYGMRLNGKSTDEGKDIAVDAGGQAWVAVGSNSFYSPVETYFPLKNNLDPVNPANGVRTALVQINAAGNDVLMSTYTGSRNGRGDTIAVTINGTGEAIVGGSSGNNMILVDPLQAQYGGGDADAYLQRIGFRADLSITKTVDKPLPQFTVLPGESLTYTIVVTNSTGDTARNVIVTDNLPSEVVFVSCVSTADGICSGSGNNRTITIPALAQGATATITVATAVAAGVGPGQVWTNTANVTSNAASDPNPANNTGNIGNGAPTLTNPTADADGDGLTNGFEQKFGLNGLNNSPGEGAAGDPDGDGKTNAQEQAEGTHPRGFVITYLAEGATGPFFDTRLALANPTATQALVLTRFQKGDGTTISDYRVLPPFSRATIDVETVAGLEAAEFSTLVEADVQVVADRTMTWDSTGYGSHAERGILTRTATKWYFAEGATFGPFNLFYLVQNPNSQAAEVKVTYLLATSAPLTKTYVVAPQSRFNIWVDSEGATDPALAPLASAELSAIIESTNGVPIIAERAMYLDQPGRALGAGHESAGVTAPATQWFLAEGATGEYFDMFILIANPQAAPATVQADYLLDSGQVITRTYTVAGNSRFNIWVDQEPGLANAALSTRVTSTNGVPIIVERAMWWPGPASDTWQEAHNSPGETTTGTRWAMAEGEVGGARDTDTYVLIANTSAFAGTIRATVLFEDGTAPLTREFAVAASARFNIAPAADQFFPETRGKRFGMLIESVGGTPAQIVVERAMYSDDGGVNWAAGTNALATKLP